MPGDGSSGLTEEQVDSIKQMLDAYLETLTLRNTVTIKEIVQPFVAHSNEVLNQVRLLLPAIRTTKLDQVAMEMLKILLTEQGSEATPKALIQKAFGLAAEFTAMSEELALKHRMAVDRARADQMRKNAEADVESAS